MEPTRLAPQRFVSDLTRATLAVVLAGGRGSRLQQLTDWRAKPALHFGGKYRIIDFTLSNCINSGVRRIGVLTQYKAHSLILHLQRGWGHLHGEYGEFVELWPAQQRLAESWYTGTADAVYQNLDVLHAHAPRYVLVLAGDHVYKMDYGPLIAQHVRTGASVTVGCVEVPIAEASGFGVMGVDGEHRVVSFEEKPARPHPLPGRTDRALASMGIYVFDAATLCAELIHDAADPSSTHDFGRDLLPALTRRGGAYAYPFRADGAGQLGYWRDVGTPDAYYDANMDLVAVTPALNLYDRDWPVWTHAPQLPPAKFVFDEEGRRGMAVDSMVSGGCVVAGGDVHRSILFSGARVDGRARVTDSLVLPGAHIGAGCQVHRSIIESGCELPAGTRVGVDAREDAARFARTPGGVTVVTLDMLGQRPGFAAPHRPLPVAADRHVA
jgi:glucose-1-phosphate adenylyltransferase